MISICFGADFSVLQRCNLKSFLVFVFYFQTLSSMSGTTGMGCVAWQRHLPVNMIKLSDSSMHCAKGFVHAKQVFSLSQGLHIGINTNLLTTIF